MTTEAFDKKSLVNMYSSKSAYLLAIIYVLLGIFIIAVAFNGNIITAIENMKIADRAIVAGIMGTSAFKMNTYFLYFEGALLIVAAILLVFHKKAAPYLSIFASVIFLGLAIIGLSLFYLIMFVVALILTLRAWDSIDLVEILRTIFRETEKKEIQH